MRGGFELLVDGGAQLGILLHGAAQALGNGRKLRRESAIRPVEVLLQPVAALRPERRGVSRQGGAVEQTLFDVLDLLLQLRIGGQPLLESLQSVIELLTKPMTGIFAELLQQVLEKLRQQ